MNMENKEEPTLVELFEELRRQFYEAHGRYFTPQEAAILTDEIREEIKRGKQSDEN